MCLQWCHVTHQLIDNDLPCDHCPTTIRFAQAKRSCAGCQHWIERTPLPICAMTHGQSPLAACCHYNCTPDTGLLYIGPEQVAIGLLEQYAVGRVAELFGSPNPDPIAIPLADLAVPDVYGLTADEWDFAF